ncbi:hypothetical protein SK128_018888 [Halocaridina rubra]|uniref:Uncharacterized protein n=1 Tax=Halocaridina rubra TaxID=373956 RepID=A0AAN9AB54_HALRR
MLPKIMLPKPLTNVNSDDDDDEAITLTNVNDDDDDDNDDNDNEAIMLPKPLTDVNDDENGDLEAINARLTPWPSQSSLDTTTDDIGVAEKRISWPKFISLVSEKLVKMENKRKGKLDPVDNDNDNYMFTDSISVPANKKNGDEKRSTASLPRKIGDDDDADLEGIGAHLAPSTSSSQPTLDTSTTDDVEGPGRRSNLQRRRRPTSLSLTLSNNDSFWRGDEYFNRHLSEKRNNRHLSEKRKAHFYFEDALRPPKIIIINVDGIVAIGKTQFIDHKLIPKLKLEYPASRIVNVGRDHMLGNEEYLDSLALGSGCAERRLYKECLAVALLQKFLRRLYRQILSKKKKKEEEEDNRLNFIILKGGIASGAIIHNRNIVPDECFVGFRDIIDSYHNVFPKIDLNIIIKDLSVQQVLGNIEKRNRPGEYDFYSGKIEILMDNVAHVYPNGDANNVLFLEAETDIMEKISRSSVLNMETGGDDVTGHGIDNPAPPSVVAHSRPTNRGAVNDTGLRRPDVPSDTSSKPTNRGAVTDTGLRRPDVPSDTSSKPTNRGAVTDTGLRRPDVPSDTSHGMESDSDDENGESTSHAVKEFIKVLNAMSPQTDPVPIDEVKTMHAQINADSNLRSWLSRVKRKQNKYEMILIIYFATVYYNYYERINARKIFNVYKQLARTNFNAAKYPFAAPFVDYYTFLVKPGIVEKYFKDIQRDTYLGIVKLWQVLGPLKEAPFNFFASERSARKAAIYEHKTSRKMMYDVPPEGLFLGNFYDNFKNHLLEWSDDILPLSAYVDMELTVAHNKNITLIATSSDGVNKLLVTPMDGDSHNLSLRFFINMEFDEMKYQKDIIELSDNQELIVGIDPTMIYVKNNTDEDIRLELVYRFVFHTFI